MPRRRINRFQHQPTLTADDQVYALRPAGKDPETLIAVHRWTHLKDNHNVVAYTYITAGVDGFQCRTQVCTPVMAQQRIDDMASAFDIQGWLIDPVTALAMFQKMTGGDPAPCRSCCGPMPVGAVYCPAPGCGRPVPARPIRDTLPTP